MKLKDSSRVQRWVVFGGSGFVGRALLMELQNRGIAAVSLPAPRLKMSVSDDATQLLDGLRSSLAIQALSEVVQPGDVVVNAAGIASPGAKLSDELLGANSLLPGLIAQGAADAGAAKFVHISSAAVQGNIDKLTSEAATNAFSPYSTSKSMGEEILNVVDAGNTEVVIIRATSVQGPGRATTESLRNVARSPLSSVASPGSQPTTISSIYGLATFIIGVGQAANLPPIMVQPWEGATVSLVLQFAGSGKQPIVLPAFFCRTFIWIARYISSRTSVKALASVRRLELMWFGQDQENCEFFEEVPKTEFLKRSLS